MSFLQSRKYTIPHSPFNLSYSHFGSGFFGKLYPCFLQNVNANDIVDEKTRILIKTINSYKFSLMCNIKVDIHYFFIPYRILDENFESFYTGFKKDVVPPEEYTDLLDPWYPSTNGDGTTSECFEGSIWDYYGFETDVPLTLKTFVPFAALKRGYNLCWNEYYRDQNLQETVDINNPNILWRNWPLDYFTSMLPFRQKGTVPSIPLSGTGSAVFNGVLPELSITSNRNNNYISAVSSYSPNNRAYTIGDFTGSTGATLGFRKDSSSSAFTTVYGNSPLVANVSLDTNTSDYNEQLAKYLADNSIDLSNVATLTMYDLRLLSRLQFRAELNAVAGTRFFEWLIARFDTSPKDLTLRRPEYLGAISFKLPIQEVIQTSETTATSELGNRAGITNSISSADGFRYRAEEPGMIIGLLSIIPDVVYSGGIPRWALNRSQLEWYSPEFAYLSEQGVYKGELKVRDTDDANFDIMGYTGMFNEYRLRHNVATSKFRGDFGYAIYKRNFTNDVTLNNDFISMKDVNYDNFMVKDTDAFVWNVYHDNVTLSMMPDEAIPRLM